MADQEARVNYSIEINGVYIMKLSRNLKSLLCLVLAAGMLWGMLDCIGKAEESLSYSRIAANAEDMLEHIEQDVEMDESMTDAALAAILLSGNAIVWNADTGDYTFSLLEVEHTDLTCDVSRLFTDHGDAALVVSFYPQGVPSIAASVIISESTGSLIDIFEGSTWQMSQYWEQETGKPAYFRSVSERFLFHCLFEPANKIPAAAIPDDEDLSAEQAMGIAEDALISEGLVLSGQSLEQYRIGTNFNRTNQYGKAHNAVWYVSYYAVEREDYLLMYTVELDGHNGKVLNVRHNNQGLG